MEQSGKMTHTNHKKLWILHRKRALVGRIYLAWEIRNGGTRIKPVVNFEKQFPKSLRKRKQPSERKWIHK